MLKINTDFSKETRKLLILQTYKRNSMSNMLPFLLIFIVALAIGFSLEDLYAADSSRKKLV
jgi:hypothetical protein